MGEPHDLPGDRAGRAIAPARGLRARVEAPPSKSVMQRALIAAALAPGRSRLRNPLLAGDTRLLMAALSAVDIPARVADTPGETLVEVDGRGGRIPAERAAIDVGNAGTAMRFLTALLAIGGGAYIIDGDGRMRRRPIADLLEALRGLGAAAESVEGNGFPPVRVGGRGLAGGTVRLSGSRSSQFVSAILLAAPAARRDVVLELEGTLVSKPYVDLTLDVMACFGIQTVQEPPGPTPRRYTVKAGQSYRPVDLTIEGDYSSASYFFAAAAVAIGRVQVDGLDPHSKQGDARFPELLARMGCRVERGAGFVAVESTEDLRGIDADLSDLPDIAPTLAVVAMFARGRTRITGVPHLRLKESDRIAALVTEIRRLGGEAVESADGLTVMPRPLRGAAIETYDDHRMAMAFAVAGLAVPGVSIRNAGCVAKSFPSFWDLFSHLAERSPRVP